MYIRVHVYPERKVEEIKQKKEGVFEIYVKEKTQENQANDRVLAILKKYPAFINKHIRLVNGHHRPHKLFLIENHD